VTKAQVKQMIKSEVQPLLKYIDTIVTLSSTVNNFTITNLNMPTLGNGQNNRNADTIVIEKFDVMYTIAFEDNVTTSADLGVDRLLFYQNAGEAIISTVGDLFDQTTTALNVVNSPISYSNTGGLLRVNHDFRQESDTFNPCHIGKFTYEPNIRKMRYNANGAQWSSGYPAVGQQRYIGTISGGATYISQFIIRMWFRDV